MQTTLETWAHAGMAVMWESRLIKDGSEVRSTIALSSGESDTYALLRSTAHAVGIKAMLNDRHYGVRMRDSHALRQQRGRRHVCSARLGENSTFVATTSSTRRTFKSTQCHDKRSFARRIQEVPTPC